MSLDKKRNYGRGQKEVVKKNQKNE